MTSTFQIEKWKLNRTSILLLFMFYTVSLFGQGYEDLKAYHPETISSGPDWLLTNSAYKADFYKNERGDLIMSNGLITRVFSRTKNFATIGLDNLMTGESMLRAIRPEAELTINGLKLNIGGLVGQPIENYLSAEFIENLKLDPKAIQLVKYKTGETNARFAWKKRPEWMPKDLPWPAPGKSLELEFRANAENIAALAEFYNKNEHELHFLKELSIRVHYELFDGIPLICKWIEIINNDTEEVLVNSFKSEILAFVESESDVDGNTLLTPNVSLETDFRFGGMAEDNLFASSVSWKKDSTYSTQVNYNLNTPVLLEASPRIGPEKTLAKGEKLVSFRTWELFHDSWARERKGLAVRSMYRSQAPWVTENPILMHVRSAKPEDVKKAIDQSAEVGFQMVIMTFGSGFNLENQGSENMKTMKDLADYAHQKGVALGGYSLLASRSIDAENDVQMPVGMKPRFNQSPCLSSQWGKEYFKKLYKFYEQTGQDILEHDGSYPGDICISTTHPGHKGLADSQWEQYQVIKEFYEWCRAKGIYLNVPDHYFMAGSNKTGMGYRETNWSQPRAYQEIIERQNIYDGTWTKTPSMGWMFVPLVEYHGGGKAATIEPLKDHLAHYGQRLANLFGAGVQACYRGPQLYDSPETKEVVKTWVDFYRSHRAVLNGDIIHVRRPDGKDFDGLLHVDPMGKEKGLIMLYNPLNEPIKKKIFVNLYYTGLREMAKLEDNLGQKSNLTLSRDYKIALPIDIPAKGVQWFIVK